METRNDVDIAAHIESLLNQTEIPLIVEVREGVARLTGRVESQRVRQAALDLARSVDGVLGIDDQIDYEVVAPDTYFEPPDDDEEFGYADRESLLDDISDTEPTFEGDVGAWDFQEAIEEGEPYFPPTDPVVRPTTDEQELDVLGGFSETSMDEMVTDPDLEPWANAGEPDVFSPRQDGDIQRDVENELREDSYTTDLPLHVNVVNGIVFLHGKVHSIDDAEYAEEVAGRVPGVAEVQDLTEVAGA